MRNIPDSFSSIDSEAKQQSDPIARLPASIVTDQQDFSSPIGLFLQPPLRLLPLFQSNPYEDKLWVQ